MAMCRRTQLGPDDGRPLTNDRLQDISRIAQAEHRDGQGLQRFNSARTSGVVSQSMGEPTQHEPKPRA